MAALIRSWDVTVSVNVELPDDLDPKDERAFKILGRLAAAKIKSLADEELLDFDFEEYIGFNEGRTE